MVSSVRCVNGIIVVTVLELWRMYLLSFIDLQYFQLGVPNARACGASPTSEKTRPGILEHVRCVFECLDCILPSFYRCFAAILPLFSHEFVACLVLFAVISSLFDRYCATIRRYVAVILLLFRCYFPGIRRHFAGIRRYFADISPLFRCYFDVILPLFCTYFVVIIGQ